MVQVTSCLSFTNQYRPKVPEPAPSLSQHGALVGGIQVFSRDQSNCDSSDAYVQRSEHENEHT